MLRTIVLGSVLAIASACPSAGQSADQPANATGSAAAVTPDHLHVALELYHHGNFVDAIAEYQQALREKPGSPEAYAGLTRIYLKQKNVDMASETISKGLALADSPSLHVAQGEVYFRQGRISTAEREWVEVINSGHADARAYLGLARVKNALSMYETGKAMIDRAHSLDPGDPEITRHWINTLPRAERIKYLEDYLARPNDLDNSEHLDSRRYLDYLKNRAKEGGRGCHLATKLTSAEIPLVRLLIDPSHLRGYGLDVGLNDHKVSLMLDTGASGILIDRNTAEKSGITRVVETQIGGIGDKGRKDGYVGLARSIKIGGLEFQDCSVEVLDNRSVVGETGLIGADVFDDFLVEIDFPKEKFRLSELPQPPDEAAQPASLSTGNEGGDDDRDSSDAQQLYSRKFHDPYMPAEMKHYTRVFRFGHELLVPTRVSDVPAKLFLLDTGAWNNQITPAAAREVTKVHRDSDTVVTGISGRVNQVYTANKAVLQFGYLRQENQYLTAFDLTSISDDTGTEISGILGFTLLRLLDIKIDYRDGLVDFGYTASPWQQ